MDSRILVFCIGIAATILALTIGVSAGSGEYLLPGILLLLTAAILLIAAPQISVFFSVALFASGLTAPGLPGQFGLFYTSAASVSGCALILTAFRRAKPTEIKLPHWLLLFFSSVVLFTGIYRGMGFQFLGSNLWGGFLYIQVLASACLVFAMPRINMPSAWWPTAILLMGILAPLPLITDLLLTHGFSLNLVGLFLQPGATINQLMMEAEVGGGLGRLTSAGVAAQSMIIAFLAFVPTANLFRVRSTFTIALLVGIVSLSLISGFRSMTAMLLFVLFLTAFFQKTFTFPRMIAGFLITTFALTIIYATAASLPLNIQRALSWLPGIDVSSVASADAEITVSWRIELWQAALRQIPDYFWIGKGFSYDSALFLAAQNGYASYDPINWALVTGAYHNGYLSLIMLFGIAGFVSGLLLITTVALKGIRTNALQWNSPILHRCYQAFLAPQVCWVLVYLTVYGDISAVFPQVFFYWAVTDSLRACDQSSYPMYAGASSDTLEEHYASVE